MKPLAFVLLLAGVLRHYSWEWFPPEIQAQVWNIAGASVIVFFLLTMPKEGTLWVMIWWLVEEAQVILCSVSWLVRPWVVKPGEAQCSALLGFDLGTIGLFAVAAILACQSVKAYRTAQKETKA